MPDLRAQSLKRSDKLHSNVIAFRTMTENLPTKQRLEQTLPDLEKLNKV